MKEGKIKRLDRLPAIPKIAGEILALDLYSEKDECKFRSLIMQDPVISAKLIGMANAANTGVRTPVVSVNDALMIIGLSRSRAVAISIAILATMSSCSKYIDTENLLTHSMGIAFSMRVLSGFIPADKRPSDDMLFLSGLLHDIGFVVIEQVDPKKCADLTEKMRSSNDGILEIEQSCEIEYGHAYLGALLAKEWGIPDEVSEAIASHHDLNTDSLIAKLIQISEVLNPNWSFQEHADIEEKAAFEQLLSDVGIPVENILSIQKIISEHLAAL